MTREIPIVSPVGRGVRELRSPEALGRLASSGDRAGVPSGSSPVPGLEQSRSSTGAMTWVIRQGEAFFTWWEDPSRPTAINHRIAFDAGYRAAESVGKAADLWRLLKEGAEDMATAERLRWKDRVRAELAKMEQSR